MAKTIASFFDGLEAGSEPTFRAEPWYNRSGDSIHYFWEEVECYRDRIDDKLTLYRSIESDSAVGCQIKGVVALIAKMGAFGIGLGHNDGTPLAIFLFVSRDAHDGSIKDAEKRYEAY